MVEYERQILDTVFQALADGTRRAMLQRLAAGEHTIGELAEPFDMSLAAVSKHITVLERAGLVQRWREGRERRCRLRPERLREAEQWLTFHHRFWNERLDALETLLAQDEEREEKGR